MGSEGPGRRQDPPGVVSEKPILPMPLLLLLADWMSTGSTWGESTTPQPPTAADTGLRDVVDETGQRPRGNVNGRGLSETHRYTTDCHFYITTFIIIIITINTITYYAPDCTEGGNKHYFCLSVCPSITYIVNSMSKFGTKVLHLKCDSHTSFKVKPSKVRVTDGRGHTVSAEPGGHTAC